MTTIRIDDVEVEAAEGEWLIDAVRRTGVDIPTLCHHEALEPIGACRVCLVEVAQNGRRSVSTSCNFRIEPGIEVWTDTEEVRRHRAMNLELLLARAPGSETIRRMAARYGVSRARFGPIAFNPLPNCILCELCVRTCAHLDHHALTIIGRGDKKRVGLPFNKPAASCVGCASCASVCPTDCIPVQDDAKRRTIWGQSFEFVACKHCQAPVMTARHREHAQTTSGLPEDYYDTCEQCKQAAASQRFAAVVW
jgi:NADH dehydrogenase/NADH:ubiquinone oxidoreductase subunit G